MEEVVTSKFALFAEHDENNECFWLATAIDRKIRLDDGVGKQAGFRFNPDAGDISVVCNMARAEWSRLSKGWHALFAAVESGSLGGLERLIELCAASNEWVDTYLHAKDVAALRNAGRQYRYRRRQIGEIPEKLALNKGIRGALRRNVYYQGAAPTVFMRLAIEHCLNDEQLRDQLIRQSKKNLSSRKNPSGQLA